MLVPPLLAGCDKVSPEAGFVAAQPSLDPVKPDTAFTGALSCLDNLMRAGSPASRGQAAELITVGLIPDATGRINPGLRDMVSNAVLGAARGSRRFVLIEAAGTRGVGGMPTVVSSQPIGGVMLGPSGGGQNEALPNAALVQRSIQIIGSLTQADKSVQQTGANAGVSVKDNTIGVGSTSDFGAVVLDLRLVQIATGVVLQSSSNALVIVNRGTSANAAIKLGSVGLNFDFSVDRREGPHQAVRTLTELSVIELLGQYANVPYKECLAADRPAPAVLEQGRRWFEAQSPEQREEYVRQRLTALGYKVPPAPASAADAISAYQVNNGLVPTGRAGFETFAKLSAGALPPSGGAIPAALPGPAAAAGRSVGIDVRESPEDRALFVNVRVDQGGFLSCFYRDERGRVVRLFPNKYQGSSFVRADRPVSIPPPGAPAPFLIKPDAMNGEIGFFCAATERDVTAQLPAGLQGGGFQQVAAQRLEDVAAAFQQVAPGLGYRITTRGAPDGAWSR